jgi:hypothetical protein
MAMFHGGTLLSAAMLYILFGEGWWIWCGLIGGLFCGFWIDYHEMHNQNQRVSDSVGESNLQCGERTTDSNV